MGASAWVRLHRTHAKRKLGKLRGPAWLRPMLRYSINASMSNANTAEVYRWVDRTYVARMKAGRPTTNARNIHARSQEPAFNSSPLERGSSPATIRPPAHGAAPIVVPGQSFVMGRATLWATTSCPLGARPQGTVSARPGEDVMMVRRRIVSQGQLLLVLCIWTIANSPDSDLDELELTDLDESSNSSW
jgi:hypothetical protein